MIPKTIFKEIIQRSSFQKRVSEEKQNTVVDDDKLVVDVRAVRMGVDLIGRSVGGPTGVRNTAMGLVDSIHIQRSLHYNHKK